MSWKVLIVEFASTDYRETYLDLLRKNLSQNVTVEFMYTDSVDKAMEHIKNDLVATVVYIAKDSSSELINLIRFYHDHVGPLPDLQMIVCDDPSPQFTADVFEFGIEQFLSHKTFPLEFAELFAQIDVRLKDPDSPESKTIALQRSIRTGDKKKIQDATIALGDLPEYDYRAAFVRGKAAEASGNFEIAIESYRMAASMNKMYRPSSNSLGESLLMVGQLDEALEIFIQLDLTNPNDIERKTQIASAYVEKGEFAKAKEYCDEVARIDPNSSRIAEIGAQIFLCQGKLGEAFKLMDKMANVGPFFATKLNDLGVQLSHSGRDKNALALYQKAHKIVRPELKYKISMNAALACRKMRDYNTALKYVARCEKEHGATFPKIQKIKQTILSERSELLETSTNDASKKVG